MPYVHIPEPDSEHYVYVVPLWVLFVRWAFLFLMIPIWILAGLIFLVIWAFVQLIRLLAGEGRHRAGS